MRSRRPAEEAPAPLGLGVVDEHGVDGERRPRLIAGGRVGTGSASGLLAASSDVVGSAEATSVALPDTSRLQFPTSGPPSSQRSPSGTSEATSTLGEGIS